LKNGHFIVVDGGYNDNAYEGKAQGTEKLISYLELLTVDNKKPIVDAWIITHAHPDHAGSLVGIGQSADEYVDRIYVNGIYYNEASTDVIALDGTGGGKAWEYNKLLKESAKVLKTSATTSNTVVHPEVYRPQTGQKYYFFGDVVLDIVLTHEQIQDEIIKTYTGVDTTNSVETAFNETSTWCMFNITESGKTYKVLDGADGGTIGMTFMSNAYSTDYLAINVFHALHHGQNVLQKFHRVNGMSDTAAACGVSDYVLITQSDGLAAGDFTVMKESEWKDKIRYYGAGDLVLTFGASEITENNLQ
jgi:hypothetical protein